MVSSIRSLVERAVVVRDAFLCGLAQHIRIAELSQAWHTRSVMADVIVIGAALSGRRAAELIIFGQTRDS